MVDDVQWVGFRACLAFCALGPQLNVPQHLQQEHSCTAILKLIITFAETTMTSADQGFTVAPAWTSH